MGRRRKEITVSDMVKEIMLKKEIRNSDVCKFRGVTKGSNHLTLNEVNPKIGTLKNILESLGEELIIYANKKHYKIR